MFATDLDDLKCQISKMDMGEVRYMSLFYGGPLARVERVPNKWEREELERVRCSCRCCCARGCK